MLSIEELKKKNKPQYPQKPQTNISEEKDFPFIVGSVDKVTGWASTHSWIIL